MIKNFVQSMQRAGNERLRTYLLGMPENFLLQHGYSRESLQRGVDEWPWSIKQTPEVTEIKQIPARKELKKKGQLHETLEPLDRVA